MFVAARMYVAAQSLWVMKEYPALEAARDVMVYMCLLSKQVPAINARKWARVSIGSCSSAFDVMTALNPQAGGC